MRPFSPWLALTLALSACAEATPRVPEAGSAAASPPAAEAGVTSQGGAGVAGEPERGAPTVLRGPLPVCTRPTGSCPSLWFERQQPLLKAASFGDGAEFVDLGGQAVLLKLRDGSFRVALLPWQDTAAPERPPSWPVDAGARTPRRVLGAMHGIPGLVFVLACDAGDRTCAVLRAEGERDGLSAFAALEPLPAGFVARGLATDPSEGRDSSRPVPCVYGSGMICLSDRWRASIPGSDSLRLNRVAPAQEPRLAVGDHGRWFMRTERGWSEQEPLADVSLTGASAMNDMAVVVGGGTIQAVVGTELASYLTCVAPGELEMVWLSFGLGVLLQMANGELISHGVPSMYRKDPDCLLYRLPAAPVLARSDDPCGLSQNERVLQADALFGGNTCPVE